MAADEKDISLELQALLQEYDFNVKQIIKDHVRLDYLYALSEIRENLLEWHQFDPGARLLQVGSDYGALTGLFARRVGQVVVLDPSRDNLKTNEMRHGDGSRYGGAIQYLEGDLLDMEDGEGFGHVVMAGSLAPPFKERIMKAKSLLKPGGELILAACNRSGMKYWAGADRDPYSFSKQQLLDLAGGEEYACQVYYPMPDYKLPMAIYSPGYLPKEGDLANTVIAYDYPKYIRLEVGDLYDMVCQDGQFEYFANSFLIIWSKHACYMQGAYKR